MPSLRRTHAPAVLTAVLLTAGCTSGAIGSDPAGMPTAPATTVTSATTVTTATTAPAPPGSGTVGPSGAAADALAALPVKGRAPRTGYERERFGPAWTDDNDAAGGRNGCDTRNDILARDLTAKVRKPGTRGCVVLRGTLRDPYTGRVISFVRGPQSARVQIDHVVALSNAWQTGAQQLSQRQRVDLANDPRELLAVDGPTNQAKGDGDAATWLPPRRAVRCDYVARQIAVKRAYRLWVTPAERDAMRRVLAGCPGQRLP